VSKLNTKNENDIGSWTSRNVSPIVTLVTLITIVFGGYFWLDNHYASAEELTQLETRFEIKVRSDSLRETNSRIWQLEKRLSEMPDDITAQEELSRLKEEKAEIKRELDFLRPK